MASQMIRCGNHILGHCKRSAVFGRRWQSVASIALEKYNSGQKIHGYTVEKVVSVPELFLTAVQLSHDKTQAKHLHVARDDTNNVFGVAFSTTPMDSTGVPHILEHTALCGSQKYPIRDPFFKMLTRSLNTFMNAFTANDWTMYPFSSQNHQDYKNLMSIYLDAGFFPRLREHDFMQEGWRLENEDPNDPSTPIVIKGVVYNEMKGVFSTGQSLFVQKNQNLLMPSHTYSVISGGDPADIPKLTWQKLRDFHATHYHPSNARFYTYGSFPLEDHLQFISENALDKFSRITTDTSVPSEPRWKEPRAATMTCMPDAMAPDLKKQTTIAVSYLLIDITDTYESFVLNLLGLLLIHGDTAPFYQSLIVPNIGSDFSPVIGYDGNNRDVSFSVGLQGINSNDVDRVKDIIDKTFTSVYRNGFDQERIDALLHKIELSQKHQSDKFGLYFGVAIVPCWTHGGDVTKLIKVNDMVDKFKKNMADDPKYLQNKVKQYFMNNTHKLTLVMTPDEDFEAKRQKKEDEELSKMVAALSDKDQVQIYEKGLELLSQQMATEDLNCLPTLKVSDIEFTSKKVGTDTVSVNGTPLQLCTQPTNGVTYFHAVADISDLPANLLPYVPLFCSIVASMGAGDYDYKQLSQKIELKTGGLGASTHIMAHHSQVNSVEQGIHIASHCLDQNIDEMFSLWKDIFQRLDITNLERLMTLIMMEASDLANSIAGSGHRYAMTHSASSLSPGGALREQTSGMTQISLMKSIAEGGEPRSVLYALRDIAAHVFTNTNMRCAVNATPECMPTAQKSTENFINNITQRDTGSGYFHAVIPDFKESSCWTHFELPFQVNYAARSMKTVPYTHADHASLRILSSLMGTKYLHREIREKGGAYGGGAVGNTPGQFTFFSYRDPNSERTLEVFDGAIKWALEGSFSQQDIDESKLAVFSQVDAPIAPGSQGLREFLSDIDYDMYQAHREQLFAVMRDDLARVTKQYLATDSNTSSVSLLGPENQLSKDQRPWKIIKQS